MKKKTIVLLVGHNSSAKGARNSHLGISEYDYNLDLSLGVENEIKSHIGSNLVDVVRIFGNISNTSKHNLVNKIHSESGVPLVVDMHLNAGSPTADYSLVKYARISPRGFEAAKCFINNITKGYAFGKTEPSISFQPARWADMIVPGCMPTDRRPPKSHRGEDYKRNEWKYRGSEFLYNTIPPAILIEPFFISNNHTMSKMITGESMDRLAMIIADSIIVYMFSVGDLK